MKRLYPILTHSPDVSNPIKKEMRLTLREKLAILFSGGIEITLVSEEDWTAYIQRILGDDDE